MLEAGDDRATAGSHLAEAAAIARRLGARRLLDDIEALARRARLELAAEHPAGDGLGAARRPGAEARVLGGAGAETAEASPPEPQPAADPFGLTDREHEVLRLLAQGLTNRRIGENLFISESTAGVHVSNILGKLGVSSRTEAAAVAVRLGLAE
jgi:DNA-binding CsgD family transcriptional regulator